MTTLRRLLLCLFALALLPGAQARVAMPAQAAVAAVADAAGAEPGGCHDAPIVEPATHPGAFHADSDPGGAADDATPPTDCCPGHDDEAPACGGACACPGLAPTALMHAPVAGSAFLEGRSWQRHGHATRTSPPDGPPQRPPIG